MLDRVGVVDKERTGRIRVVVRNVLDNLNMVNWWLEASWKQVGSGDADYSQPGT